MRRLFSVATAAALAIAAPAAAHKITIAYVAEAVTVVDDPFGVEVPRLTEVTGYFTYDTDTPDENPSAFDGEYQHDGDSGFLAEFLGHKVTGSHDAFVWVDLVNGSPESDTFRIQDGNALFRETGVMSFDGNPDETIELFLAITEDAFDNDSLINPFPFYDFGFLGTSHTFSLENEDGTMLLQFLAAQEAVCGDATMGGGITAGDALKVLGAAVALKSCIGCICDTDSNGNVTTSDAQRILRRAVGSLTSLSCAACL